MAVAGSYSAYAAENWETSGDLELLANQTSNPRLDVDDGNDSDTLETYERVKLGVKRSTRVLDLSAGAELEFIQFAQSNLFEDEENQRANIAMFYKPGRRTYYGFYGRYAHENYSTRNAAQDTVGEDLSEIDPTLNDAQQQFRIDRFLARPTIDIDVSQRSKARIAVQYRQSNFSDEVNLSDYGTTETWGEWTYKLADERLDSIKFKVGYNDYRSDGAIELINDEPVLEGQLDGEGILAGVTYARTFKNGLYVAASAGAIQFDFDVGGIEKETEPQFGLFISNGKPEDRHSYSLSYNDYYQPNANGILIKSQIVRVAYEYRLTRLSNIGFKSLIFTNENQTGRFIGSTQDYFNIEPYYAREFGRNLTVELKYRYRELERESGFDSDDHAITATVRYRLWGKSS